MLPRLLLLLGPSYEAAKPVPLLFLPLPHPVQTIEPRREKSILPIPIPPLRFRLPLPSPLKRTHERCGWKWRDGRRRRPNLFVGLGSVCPSSPYSQKSSLAQALLLRRNEGPFLFLSLHSPSLLPFSLCLPSLTLSRCCDRARGDMGFDEIVTKNIMIPGAQ